jgi:hypothetical protein
MNVKRREKILQTLQDNGYTDFEESDIIIINEILKNPEIDYQTAINQWASNNQKSSETPINQGLDLNQFISVTSDNLRKSLKRQIVFQALQGVASDFHQGNFLDLEDSDLNVLGDITQSLRIEPVKPVRALAPVLDNVSEYPV